MFAVAALANSWFVLALLLPGTLAPATTFISEHAARGQPFAYLFRAADLLTGASLLLGVLAGGWRAPRNRWLLVAGAALFTYGACTLADSVLPLDCVPSVDPGCRVAELAGSVSVQHQAHSVTGVVEGVAVVLASYGLSLGTRFSPGWAGFSRAAGVIGALQVGFAIAVSWLWLAGVLAVGWPQRLATVLVSVLFAMLAANLWRQELDPAAPPAWPGPDSGTRMTITGPDGAALAVTIREPESAGTEPLPTVLLVNGLSLPAALWAPVVQRLPAARVASFDRPGLGASRGQPGLALAEQATQLQAVARAAAPSGRIVVVAHSHGALAAGMLARREPQRVAALVLVDPSIPTPHHPATHAAQRLAVAIMGLISSYRYTAAVVGRPTTWLQLRAGTARADCYWPPLHLRQAMATQRRLLAAIAELRTEPDDLVTAASIVAVDPLPVPVTVVAGTRGGWPAYLPARGWAARLEARTRDLRNRADPGVEVRFQALAGAHLLMLDTPDELAAIIADVSRRVT